MIGPKLTIELTNNGNVLATWLYPKETKYETVDERTKHVTYTRTNRKKRDRFIALILNAYFGEPHPDDRVDKG